MTPYPLSKSIPDRLGQYNRTVADPGIDIKLSEKLNIDYRSDLCSPDRERPTPVRTRAAARYCYSRTTARSRRQEPERSGPGGFGNPERAETGGQGGATAEPRTGDAYTVHAGDPDRPVCGSMSSSNKRAARRESSTRR